MDLPSCARTALPVLLLAAALSLDSWARAADPGGADGVSAGTPDDDRATVVVVTGEREGRRQDDTAAALSVVSGKSIEDRAPGDFAGVLREVPGVDVQDMSPAGYGANVSIRGSSDFKPGGFGNRVLVLLDGWPLNDPDTDGVDWSAVPVFDLGRVEVLRGPASALYGSTAVGGVVQLFAPPPKTGAELSLGQGFAGWDANRSKVAGSFSEGTGDFGLRASGWLQRYAGLEPAGQNEFRYNSDSDSYGLRLTAEGQVADHQAFDGMVAFGGSAGGNPGFEGTSEISRSRRFDRNSLLTGLRYRYDAGQGLDAEAKLFWMRFRGKVADPDGGNANLYDSDRVGLRGQLGFLLLERTRNIAGAELQLDNVGGSVFQLGAAADQKRNYQNLVASAFLQSQIDLGAGFEVTAGARFDSHWFSTNQNFLSVSPKARLAFRPDDQTVIWTAVNRGFRVPTIGELYLKYNTTYGLMFQGNPALQPESLWAFELGARRRMLGDHLHLEAVLFCNLGLDTIEFVYSSPVSAVNLHRSRVLGGELAARAVIARWLDLGGSVSLMDARDLDDGSQMLYRPVLKGNLSVFLHRWNWELAVHLLAVGSRLYDDFLDSQDAVQDPVTGRLRFPRRTLDPYVLLDVDLSFRAPVVVVALHVTNLLASAAFVIQDYPPPGREWFLEARLPWP